MALVVIMPMLLGNLTVQSLRTVSKSPRYFFIALLGFSLFWSKAPLLSNFQQIRSSFYKNCFATIFFPIYQPQNAANFNTFQAIFCQC